MGRRYVKRAKWEPGDLVVAKSGDAGRIKSRFYAPVLQELFLSLATNSAYQFLPFTRDVEM